MSTFAVLLPHNTASALGTVAPHYTLCYGHQVKTEFEFDFSKLLKCALWKYSNQTKNLHVIELYHEEEDTVHFSSLLFQLTHQHAFKVAYLQAMLYRALTVIFVIIFFIINIYWWRLIMLCNKFIAIFSLHCFVLSRVELSWSRIILNGLNRIWDCVKTTASCVRVIVTTSQVAGQGSSRPRAKISDSLFDQDPLQLPGTGNHQQWPWPLSTPKSWSGQSSGQDFPVGQSWLVRLVKFVNNWKPTCMLAEACLFKPSRRQSKALLVLEHTWQTFAPCDFVLWVGIFTPRLFVWLSSPTSFAMVHMATRLQDGELYLQ